MLEAKIHRWIRAAYAAARDYFATKSCLCFHIFHDLLISNTTIIAASVLATHDTPFYKADNDALLQLFDFADDRHSLEKLFYVFLRTRLQERVM